MLDTLIVFALLGAISLLIVHVLPGQSEDHPATTHRTVLKE